MARYGLIADIHGNREALAAALGALDARGAERIVCLGDIVGYNADPDECVALVRKRCSVAIAGNHELIGLGRLDFKRCSNNAEYALRRTRRTLGKDAAAYLKNLPNTHVLEPGIVLVHGGVRDVQQYMANPAHIQENARYLAADFPGARVCFFGHSHEQRVYEVTAAGVQEVAIDGQVPLRKENTYFVNPGSVDASRKNRHKLAECALFDSAFSTVEFLRVRYDAAATEAKAAAFGYRIDPLTDRLYTLRRRIGARF
ncbi:MAG TPA: metallophosphoesterase family protein [Burkholderiales bacterium]